MTALPVVPIYGEAVRVAVVIQVLLALFLGTILDGGRMAVIGGCVMLGFWIGVAIIMVRRPRNPRLLDLLYIRWGYPVMVLPFLLAI